MPNREKAVSLKDIAEVLGVSYSLVSKVMGGKMGNTRARPEIVEAIQKKAAELNYQPHPLAGALKSGRKGAVGVLIHSIGEEGTEIAANLLRGISAGLDEKRLRLWLRFFESDDEFLLHFDKRARHDMDGVIVAGIAHPATFELIKKLHLSGLPVVSVLESSTIPEVSNIVPDTMQQG
ncbi:MAG: LacI family DNA-binding transcriptional regulator, partial [Rariglobus sp.]